jgi:hypothetical protein
MSTMTTTPEETKPVTPAAKAPKLPKSFSVTLADGSGALLRITAIRKKEGATTHVDKTTKGADGKRRNERGMTAAHPSLDAAKVAVGKLATEAGKLGWAWKEGAARGYTARPDAFTTLPAAGAVAPKPAKKR